MGYDYYFVLFWPTVKLYFGGPIVEAVVYSFKESKNDQ